MFILSYDHNVKSPVLFIIHRICWTGKLVLLIKKSGFVVEENKIG